MPNINDMMGSKYLKKEDVPSPVLVTIQSVAQVQFEEKGVIKKKWTMKFSEMDKPMVINSTNIQLAARALGEEETEDWIGKKIILYTDPNVSMAGQLVGGLRLRKYTPKPKAKPAPAPPPPEDDEDYAPDIDGEDPEF